MNIFVYPVTLLDEIPARAYSSLPKISNAVATTSVLLFLNSYNLMVPETT